MLKPSLHLVRVYFSIFPLGDVSTDGCIVASKSGGKCNLQRSVDSHQLPIKEKTGAKGEQTPVLEVRNTDEMHG